MWPRRWPASLPFPQKTVKAGLTEFPLKIADRLILSNWANEGADPPVVFALVHERRISLRFEFGDHAAKFKPSPSGCHLQVG